MKEERFKVKNSELKQPESQKTDVFLVQSIKANSLIEDEVAAANLLEFFEILKEWEKKEKTNE